MEGDGFFDVALFKETRRALVSFSAAVGHGQSSDESCRSKVCEENRCALVRDTQRSLEPVHFGVPPWLLARCDQ